MIIIDKLIRLTRRLYPKGRALNMYIGSMLERVHKALARSERRIHNDSVEVLDTILPDNDNFTAVDATRWEERLGMITNSNVDLEDRKLAIKRKLNYPGLIRARQSIDYLQGQLNDAGFNVYCYRSNGLTPYQILYSLGEVAQLGDVQMGDTQMGDVYTYYSSFWQAIQFNDIQMGGGQMGQFVFTNGIMNTIPEEFITFTTGFDWVFYVGGNPIGTIANVPIERKNEFRQLILRLKPVNSAAYLFINYN
jgi:hypothetical protein